MMLNVCDDKEKRGQLMSNIYRIAEFLWIVEYNEVKKKVGSGQ